LVIPGDEDGGRIPPKVENGDGIGKYFGWWDKKW
jgi:hypothetical protein